MKKLYLLCLSVLCIGGINAQTLNWGNPVTVATGYNNLRPRIVLTNNDIPVVMWGGGNGSQPLYTARWNGSSFNTPVQVTPNGIDPMVEIWAGPDIASSGDDVWVVFKVQPENSNPIYSVKSTDGGTTFGDTALVTVNSFLNRFPAVGADNAGNPVVSFMHFSQSWTFPEYVVATTGDGGDSWNPYVMPQDIGGGEACDCCPGEIISEGNRQVMMFRNNISNIRDTWIAVSNDGGATFPTAADVDLTDWQVFSCQSTGPDGIFYGDTLIAVWMSGATGDDRVNIGTIDLNTLQLGVNNEIAPNTSSVVNQNYPRIDGENGVVGIVYQEVNAGNYDTYLAYSYNGSTGVIENSQMLNANASGNQRNPDIAYSNGVFHMVYSDDATGNVVYRTATLTGLGLVENNDNITINISPNPFKEETTIRFENADGLTLNLEVYDVSGKLVVSSQTTGNSFLLNRGELSSGIYQLRISSEGKLLGNEKLVIE